MKLTTEELTYVDSRLESFHIIYQEVYDEIADHFITAIEVAREQGDQRRVEIIFNEIIENQFPGNHDIQKIAAQYVFAYNRKIRKTMRANMVFYVNWQAVLFIGALIVIGFYLPRTTWMFAVMMFLLLIAAYVPFVYTFKKMKGVKLRSKKRRWLRVLY